MTTCSSMRCLHQLKATVEIVGETCNALLIARSFLTVVLSLLRPLRPYLIVDVTNRFQLMHNTFDCFVF